jgi:hypothetical protein
MSGASVTVSRMGIPLPEAPEKNNNWTSPQIGL